MWRAARRRTGRQRAPPPVEMKDAAVVKPSVGGRNRGSLPTGGTAARPEAQCTAKDSARRARGVRRSTARAGGGAAGPAGGLSSALERGELRVLYSPGRVARSDHRREALLRGAPDGANLPPGVIPTPTDRSIVPIGAGSSGACRRLPSGRASRSPGSERRQFQRKLETKEFAVSSTRTCVVGLDPECSVWRSTRRSAGDPEDDNEGSSS